MPTVLTSSQQTFVDITDQRKLSAYITSNLPKTQSEDPNVLPHTYAPSWATNNLVLTPVVFLDQTSIPLGSTGLTIQWKRKDGTAAETALTTGESVSGGILTVNQNNKNPFGFELAGVVVNDSVTREAITRDQMKKFLKFVHDDNCYCKYYEVVYILFHTGMRISEFCGLTISDIDFEHHLINIDHQLQRSADMTLVIQETKTHAGTRKLPMTADVEQCFRAIIEDRPTPRIERMVDGHSGFLFLDKDCLPEVAMHWEHRFNHMVKRYNDIYRVQMPNITPHVCRHTYCSNQAKAGMNPKTLQYLMGHSDIGVTLNTYTHLGLEDAAEELRRMEEAEAARREQEKLAGKAKDSQKLFNAV